MIVRPTRCPVQRENRFCLKDVIFLKSIFVLFLATSVNHLRCVCSFLQIELNDPMDIRVICSIEKEKGVEQVRKAVRGRGRKMRRDGSLSTSVGTLADIHYRGLPHILAWGMSVGSIFAYES